MTLKSPSQRPNVTQSENRNLVPPNRVAMAARRAVILAAVLVSWCGIRPGGDTAQAQSAPPYPKGVWAPNGPFQILPPALVANMGIVGLNVSEDWSDINPAPGVYDWSALDDEIGQAVTAGFKINITINNGSDKTPQWLLDALPADQKIDLLDPASNHSTFCQPIATALYWNPVYHQARLDLIAAAGAHLANNPAVQGFTASFANHHSNDWNVQDTVGIISCPACPQPSPTECGDVVVDQVQQWLDAGWTEQAMLQVGKDICDAAAAALPNQNIKLPIGVTNNILGATDPGHTNGTQTTLCRDIENYVYGNASLGIPPRSYANRFFMQRNSVTADWGDGTQYDTFTPDFNAAGGRYIKYMIRAHGHPNPPWTIPGQAGLQMIDSATEGPTNDCRLNGGPDGPCGPTCDPVCVMRASLAVSLTYAVSYIEIFQDDASNPVLYDMIRATTLALGGVPRDMPPSTPTPTPSSTSTPTPSAHLKAPVTTTRIGIPPQLS